MSTVPSWLAGVTVPGNLNVSATGTEIMGGGTSMRISLKASLWRETEAGHKEEVRETLTFTHYHGPRR